MRVLRYGTGLRAFVVIAWCATAAIAGVAIFAPGTHKEYAVFLIAGFVALILPLQLEIFGRQITFEEEAIKALSPWGHRRELTWAAVRGVTFVPFFNWYVVHGDGEVRIRVPLYLDGVNELLDELSRRGVTVPRRGAG